MTDAKYHTPEDQTLQGRVFRPSSTTELREAIEQAFDYRGDVTLELTSGETVIGYVFNRDANSAVPALELFPKDLPGVRKIPYADVASIAFTGEDAASGKSWEAWVAKKESQRRTESEQIAAAAKARGHL
jgi:hypothetical protein